MLFCAVLLQCQYFYCIIFCSESLLLWYWYWWSLLLAGGRHVTVDVGVLMDLVTSLRKYLMMNKMCGWNCNTPSSPTPMSPRPRPPLPPPPAPDVKCYCSIKGHESSQSSPSGAHQKEHYSFTSAASPLLCKKTVCFLPLFYPKTLFMYLYLSHLNWY